LTEPTSFGIVEAMWVVLALFGCERNACVEMCQSYKRWIDECGSSWEAQFPDEDWHSVDDCYDAHWDAAASEQEECDANRRSYERRSCY
jgi:hypothetical protein